MRNRSERLPANLLQAQGDYFGGEQALSLTEETAPYSFIGSPTNVWIIFQMQPTLSEITPDSIPAGASVVFYVNTNRQLIARSNTAATVIEPSTFSNGWKLRLPRNARQFPSLGTHGRLWTRRLLRRHRNHGLAG